MRIRDAKRTKRFQLELLEARALLAADVYISEFAAVNETLLVDEDGEYSDWIELYNAGPDDANLAGWYLTDDAEDLRKWSFPSQALPAGEFLVVYASSKDRAEAGSQLHTNFRLKSEGEYLGLTREAGPDSTVEASVYSPAYPEQFTDISYGVEQTGDAPLLAGGLAYFTEPTPNEPNHSMGLQAILGDEIRFDREAGFYSEPFLLTLGAQTTGTTIRYTLDGSEPTTDNGIDYSEPIAVSTTTTIRARAFQSESQPSHVETRTFLFLEDIVDQRRSTTIAAGFPSSSNINGQLIDYGMDPDIVNDNTWGPQLQAALTQIPSLSVVMHVDDLMDSRTGIFVNAQNQGDRWERPASLELLHPDGTDGFQVNAGIRVRGGYSRRDDNPKHSFRFLFREEYGDAKLNYPLFGDEGVDEFDKIDLRTAQNYSWSFNGSSTNTFLRDVFSRDMQREMGHPYTRSRFYHLYLNGQYWGLFQTQERSEARYAASNLGGNREDWDIVKNSDSLTVEATDGNLDAYNRLADFFYQDGGLSDANMADYMKAQGMNPDGTRNPDYERLLDIENLIDYMVITYYTGDKDGPGSRFTTPRVNNYYAIYNRANPDGWKFMEHDSEHTFDVGDINMVQPYAAGGAQRRYFNPHWAHQQLADTNTEYRVRFADRVAELFSHDGLLSSENVNSMIDTRAAEIDMAIIAESARWGDAKRGNPRTKSDWVSAVSQMKSFTTDRRAQVIDQLRQVEWYPNLEAPEFLVDGIPQNGGELAADKRLTIAAAVAPVNFDRRLIGAVRAWKYLDDGTDQGTAWRAPDFDDSVWETGRAPLGYGDNGERTVLNYGPDASDKYVTTYFRKEFTLTNPGDYSRLKVRVARDDGAIVYLNGVEIARSNMPDGPVDYQTGAAGVASGGNETAFFEFELDANQLVTGRNVVAAEVHQVKNGNQVTSSDIGFDLELWAGQAVDPTNLSVYYTTDGSDPRLPGGELAQSATKYDPDGLELRQTSNLSARARSLEGEWGPILRAEFIVDPGSILGDLDGDSQLTANDIDLLAAAIARGDNDMQFDLDGANGLNILDFDYLITSVFETELGDADLDRDVDFADFLIVSANFGKQDTGWARGNFDFASQGTTFADFLVLSANFGRQPE